VEVAREAAAAFGYELEHRQSNFEGELVEAIQGARNRVEAIVFNPGAFTHYAHALADALAAYDGVVVELHLSNPSAREAWRRTSVIAPVATGTIAGFGGTGYRLAVEAAITMIEELA
jgi:3-dehydroquinate dehydratase-2